MDAVLAHDAALEGEFNLLTTWWFYVLLFLALYAFTVAVHLYFDYRQWWRDQEREEKREQEGAPQAPNEKKKDK
eukprot:CAMPEP_0168456106 /NCGR_PEP_ID=MMETSP0228-20121227/51111_1 /TAXON_ID=133427 /ORGANISM="Protoceratium reticulatum, Strain CCCM 535 (=CCMP 1889)" /LENGTH=73 /DNA_ID=CAMNT_0008471005 /DNA_START=32 /DNA_END=253 /DNA_ORIENTATION=+